MKIETKYHEGDKIFFLHGKKVIETIVQGFKIERMPKGEKMENVVTYMCGESGEKQVFIKVDEEDAFKTKEQLLRSL